ncbi:MAG: ATP-binding cassette domain-containing protein [Flavobacteriales bacterium]
MTTPVMALRSFGIAINNKKILRSIDLEIPSAGITVILGPSGTGKSTLLRTLAGINDHNRAVQCWGEACYQNHPLAEQTARPALVLQKVTHMVATVLDSLLSNLPNRSMLTRPEQLISLQQHCDMLGQSWIMDQLGTSVLQLDLYQQRILSMVRETLSQPALLMLDEPTVGLNDQAAQQMCSFIRQLAAKQPVVLVSHNLAQCRQLANRVILIASGRVQESSDVEQFFTAASSESAQIYLRTGSCPEQSELEEEMTAAGLEPESGAVSAQLSRPVTGQPTAATDMSKVETTICYPSQLSSDMQVLPAQIVAKTQAKSHFMGPRDFVWLISGCIAGTPWPGIVRAVDEDLSYLRDVGITQLLSLTESPFPAETAARFGMRVLHLPIVDMCAPSIPQAHACCVQIDQSIIAGQTIAVHCKAGLGRTGTILAAYWLWTRQGQVSATQAIAHIRSLNAKMIQSDAQTQFIADFAKYLAQYLATTLVS